MKNNVVWLIIATAFTTNMQLNSMNNVVSHEIPKFQLHDHITTLIIDKQFDSLQEILDDQKNNSFRWYEYIFKFMGCRSFKALQKVLDHLTEYSAEYSIEAHEAVIGYLKSLKPTEIETIFNKPSPLPQSIKIALELVYMQKNNRKLCVLNCHKFVKKPNCWVNGANEGSKTDVFSQKNIQYSLPLIEPLLGENVTILDLDASRLKDLPSAIHTLANLKVLFLCNNDLSFLPKAIGNLKSLENLYIYNNQLTTLPDSIGNLVNLKVLKAFNNKLTTLPKSIENLVNLEELDLSDNPLTPETKEWLKEIFGNKVHF